MAKLLNSEFLHSPLAVTFEITGLNADGWRSFHLLLTSDPANSRVVASCTGQLSADDYERLGKGLQDLLAGKLNTLGFSPTEPSFLLRMSRLKSADFEFLWVVDQGVVERDYSTDTGIGILMTVQPREMQEFLVAFTDEGDTFSRR